MAEGVPGKETERDDRAHVERLPFNPMFNYVYLAIAIVITYGSYSLAGLEALLIAATFFMVLLLRETAQVLNTIEYGFARKASYYNAGVGLSCFVVLVLNSYWIIQFGLPLVLPQFDGLTLICPVFILMSLFGCRNIRMMYAPSKAARD
ncbi:MAG: hypothetical protein HXY34_05290 [Candidatus Thorarchaeota archaeon]|nr:hypothetical protein [Candidatus Thorarchaeota archaeon]